MTIGEKIKSAREKAGLSMEDLARKSDLAGRNTIYKYESNITTPSISALKKIAKALEKKIDINFID